MVCWMTRIFTVCFGYSTVCLLFQPNMFILPLHWPTKWRWWRLIFGVVTAWWRRSVHDGLMSICEVDEVMKPVLCRFEIFEEICEVLMKKDVMMKFLFPDFSLKLSLISLMLLSLLMLSLNLSQCFLLMPPTCHNTHIYRQWRGGRLASPWSNLLRYFLFFYFCFCFLNNNNNNNNNIITINKQLTLININNIINDMQLKHD